MARALTTLGSYCRNLRIHRGKNMLEQSQALRISVADISSIETGNKLPDSRFVENFSAWLGLTSSEITDLQKIATRQSNVVPFPRRPTDHTSSSIRLFRKLSKMKPSEIKKLKPPDEKARPDE